APIVPATSGTGNGCARDGAVVRAVVRSLRDRPKKPGHGVTGPQPAPAPTGCLRFAPTAANLNLRGSTPLLSGMPLMLRHLCACLFLVGTAAFASAGQLTPKELKEARQRWLKGNYEEAHSLYENLAKDAKLKATPAVGVSRCYQSQGEYEKALAAVDGALKDDAKSAELHARRAELLHFLGRWDEAEKAADAAIALDKN